MKVEIWAEVTCPWRGLGSHRVDRAVERFKHSDEVEVVHRSFPLGSDLPTDRTISVRGAPRGDALPDLLRSARDEPHPVALTPAGDAPGCGADGCAVPARS